MNANVPDTRSIIRLFRQKEVPIHIVRHCVKVARLSEMICSHLPPSILVDSRLVRAGALLHDICKMDSIREGGDHSLMGAQLLKELGFDAIAEIVRQHVFLDRSIGEYQQVNEAIIVNYADKRIKHTQLVSLDERFDDLLERYGRDEASISRIKFLYRESLDMERLIFDALPIGPDELTL